MKLKSFNYLLGFLIVFFLTPLTSEEKIDIWKNKKDVTLENQKLENDNNQEKSNLQSSQPIETTEKILIQENLASQSNEQRVYGIYEPASYDFNLNMWSTTKADDLR